jgi:hypothetical protein
MSVIDDRAALIAQTLCLVSDVSSTFNLEMDPSSDEISVIFKSEILPEDINPLCEMLESKEFQRFNIDEFVVFQSFLSGLVMAAIRINTKKNNIVLTFNT